MDAKIVYNDQAVILPLIVVRGHGPSLFGRSWLERIKLNWPSICAVTDKLSLNKVLDKHPSLIREYLGLLQGSTAKIFVSQEAQPRFHKARSVPYYLKAKVEQELQRLEKQGIITPVKFSDWAARVVSVLKTNGSICLCGDYKVTVNKAAKKDLFAALSVKECFQSWT